jgi:four helix bundle protein
MSHSNDSYPKPAPDGWRVSEAESNPIREKSFGFALMVVELCRRLQSDREYVISKQLLKSGTSIGANVEESVSAESRKDFRHKLNLALKEARESHYWLRLIDASDAFESIDVSNELAAAEEIVRLLASITRSLDDR